MDPNANLLEQERLLTAGHRRDPRRWARLFDVAPAALQRMAPSAGCAKTAFKTQGLAEASIRSLVKRGLDRPEHGLIRAFRCPRCRLWHTGHPTGKFAGKEASR